MLSPCRWRDSGTLAWGSECLVAHSIALPPMKTAPNAIASGACPLRTNTMPIRTTSTRSEEHTSELQSLAYLVCRLLLEKKKKKKPIEYYRRFLYELQDLRVYSNSDSLTTEHMR